MLLFESSTARLMLLVLTVAVGLVTMRSQSGAAFGALLVLVAAWGLLAVGAIVSRRGHRRSPFWPVFIVSAAASLLFGFGPWSDVAVRGAIPTNAKDFPAYLGGILPSTRALLGARRYVRPTPRAEIRTFDQAGRPVLRIALTGRPDHPGDIEQILGGLERFVKEDVRFFSSRPGSGVRQTVVGDALDVYLNAAYLLLSLLAGLSCGTIALAVATLPGRREVGRPATVEAPGAAGRALSSA